MTYFEIISRQFPFAGVSHTEITDKVRARFEYNERLFRRRGISELRMPAWTAAVVK